MKGFIGFTKRNLLLYFKDLQSVLFSLLTSVIVFALYLLFLKGTFVSAIEGAMRGLESLINEDDLNMLVNSLLLTGIMGSAMITVPYNCLSTIVRDRERKVDYDISATPMKRWQIILSYFLAACISSFIMTCVILTVGVGILACMGETYMQVGVMLKLYGVIALGAVSATSFFMVVMQFFKTSSASAAFFGILSAAAGFIIGAYIPISEFSQGVQTTCNLFPGSHITVLFRELLMGGVLNQMNADIGGVDQGAFAESVRQVFSFRVHMFQEELSSMQSVAYIGVLAVCAIILMMALYRMTYKRR